MSQLPDPNEEMENMEKGFKIVVRILSALFIFALIYLITSSCRVQEPIITENTGVVVNLGPQQVEVMYNVVNRPQTTKALNIYYFPEGHYLKVGDIYPPCFK